MDYSWYRTQAVPDLPQGQLGPGTGPKIQGARNHESQKEKRKKENKLCTIALAFLVMHADLRCAIFTFWSGKL